MSRNCPKCERESPRKDFRQYCARVGLDSPFEGRSDELVLIFDKILSDVAGGPKFLISTTPKLHCFLSPHGLPNHSANEKLA